MKKLFILLLLISMQVSSDENSTREKSNVSTMALGSCMPVDYDGGEDNIVGLAFDNYVKDYLVSYKEREDLRGPFYDKQAKVTILQQPEYGELRHENGPYYAYVMTPNNHHNDKVIAQVEAFGYSIKVIVYLKPSQGGWDNTEEASKTCPGSFDWKISNRGHGIFINES